ncbi:unnamed protein product [Phytophthora lilii]|uniref:Unnamed protein product n=1 Tax=Phytophthora lilii TaxID=2077276 RepID=A0A9W6YF90_9STRA|nr:unnamed protein product [Phytophthora lilii]
MNSLPVSYIQIIPLMITNQRLCETSGFDYRLFYITSDKMNASGFLTYDYAQTLYLSKTDYRLTYISGITIGQATQGVALVPGVNGDISGIGALSCSSLTVNGSSITSAPTYVVGITPGSAPASKALVLNSTSDISGINSLSASSLTGTLQTAAQVNITSLGTLTGLTIGGNLLLTGTSRSLSITGSDTGANSVGYLSINIKPTVGGTSTAITEALRITSDGFVGINQANPSEMLDIVGNAYISGNLSLAGGGLYSNAGTLQVIDQFGNMTPASLTTSSLTVSTVVPTARFIPATASATGVLWYSSTSRYFGQRVISSDEISILSYSTGATLHVGGTLVANSEIYTKGNSSANASYRGNWSSASYWGSGSDATTGSIRFGTCDATGAWLSYVPIRAGAYTNASDRRLKTNILDCPYGLEAIMRMKPRRYTMAQERTDHVGFLAQELYEIIPEVVERGVNDDMNPNRYPINPWGIDLASLTSVLCKAIQELKAEIEILEKYRVDVRARLDKLRALISE